MYADDLILLSETHRGLQYCLDKLHSYCSTWGLDVNLNKTKTLIFNNTGRLISTPFYFKNSPISNARNYTYLGVTFNIYGNFTDARQDLYKKGLKALFKMCKCFSGHQPKIKTLLHVFDHTVKLVLMYGSEIWGDFASNKLSSMGNRYFSKLCRELTVEKAHIVFVSLYLVLIKDQLI
jgi:hypothetical protein